MAAPTLYHVNWFPSSIIKNIALDLGLPPDKFVIKTITEDDLRTGEEYGILSPRRVTPILKLPDGSVLHETGAIAMFLLELFDKNGKLHPLVGDPRRGKFLQGMFYVVTECFPVSYELFQLVWKEKTKDEEKLAEVKKRFNSIFTDHLDRALQHGKNYYLGDEFTAVDIMFSYIFMTVEWCDSGFTEVPAVRSYFERLRVRKAYLELYTPDEDDPKCNPDK